MRDPIPVYIQLLRAKDLIDREYAQRLRVVTLLSTAADRADLPADPEFRAAIMGYAEWRSWMEITLTKQG